MSADAYKSSGIYTQESEAALDSVEMPPWRFTIELCPTGAPCDLV